jgi:hypothetical protein
MHPYLGVPKLVYKPKPAGQETDEDDIVIQTVEIKPAPEFVFYECYDLSGIFHYDKIESDSLPAKPSSQIINIHRNYPEYVHRIILYFSFLRPC